MDMDPNGKKNKGELLKAFKKRDVKTVLKFASSIPEHSKHSIPQILKAWNTSVTLNSPLCSAIIHGNYHMCELLLEDGVSVDGEREIDIRPLSFSLQHKQADIAELLLKSGANVNLPDGNGKTYPISWAIRMANPPHIIEKIISAGFPVNALVDRNDDMTSIQCAALSNNLEAAEVLLKHSADVNAVNASGESALNIAIRSNFPNMVKFLVKNGARLANRKAGMCPLFVAIRFERLTVTEILLDLGANIEEGWVVNEFVPPLQFALNYLNEDIIMLLLSRGANVNAKSRLHNETALHVVAAHIAGRYSGKTLSSIQVKLAKALIEKGADVNAKDREGRTPLDSAIVTENSELCILLLRESAEIFGNGCIRGDGILSNRFEYIACVSAFKSPELIKLGLERGGDYNFRDRHGLTPYHCAMSKHSPAMVKAFWQHGCPYDQPELIPGKMKEMLWYNPDVKDKTILALQGGFMNGIKNYDVEHVVATINMGAEAKGCSMKIPSTLHYIATGGNHKIARVLLEKGVPVNRINNLGQTPLYIAVQKRHVLTCCVLLQFGACYNYRISADTKPMKTLAKESPPLRKLFKKIYRSFKLVKKGNTAVMTILEKSASGEEDVLPALMNCVNGKGHTLMSSALHFGHKDLARQLMLFRIEKLKYYECTPRNILLDVIQTTLSKSYVHFNSQS